MKSTVKKIDIFSLPFQFTFGNNEKEKKTLVGGIISIFILLLSVSYLAYLCFLYFDNRIQPQIATTNIFSKEPFPMEFTEDLIAVKIITPTGKTLYDFQKEKGKVYLNMLSSYNQNGSRGQFSLQPLIPCESQELQGFLCFDMKTMNNGQESVILNYNPDDVEKEQFTIFFSVCDQAIAPNGVICENEQVIRDTLISYSTQITVRITLTQFNTKTKLYEKRIKEEPFYFDTKIGFYTKFNFQKTDVIIQEGLIIQTSKETRFFSDFKRKDISASQEFIQSEMGMKILGGLVFFIGQESVSLEIQYPQFTTLLAQFTSVFNSLLFIGIISKFFAQSEIMKQFAEMQLKVYFKQSALFLLRQTGFESEVKQAKKGGILSLWNYIKSADFKQIGNKMNISLLKKIQLIFLGDLKKEKKETIQLRIFKQLVSQSNKALNIFEIQKEILQLKIMMSLILSVEQYAAMQLCGSKLPICQDDLDSQQQELEKDINQEKSQIKSKAKPESSKQGSATVYPLQIEKQLAKIQNKQRCIDKYMSHLEKIDMIEKNEEYFQNSVDRFLTNKLPQSDLDKRILECMVGLNEVNSRENSIQYDNQNQSE